MGDRYQQTVNNVTTNYTLDLNAGLTQVLYDGENIYTYGLGRISQTNATTEYFLTDALGSVRQMTNTTADITSAQAYTPYGTNLSSAGDSETPYGFTGEITDGTGNIYLRARYYNPNDGRFLTKDTLGGEANRPLSLNRWNYVEGNPINYTDPTGHYVCTNPLPVSCQTGLIYARTFAAIIKDYVKSGSILPVEGFAWFADLSKDHFEDTRDLAWAMTIVLNDMDVNRAPIALQATWPLYGVNSPYFIGQDWLPYMNNSVYDTKLEDGEYWCDPQDSSVCVYNMKWTHSLRGDWNPIYWDKTANQAYHFWYFTAVTFFDPFGLALATLADVVHEGGSVTTYNFNDPLKGNEPPPPWNVPSQPDRNLTARGMVLGSKLEQSAFVESLGCPSSLDFLHIDIGSWIRSNLK